jgi:ribosomal protein S18 acetylase RimI-like enzyme
VSARFAIEPLSKRHKRSGFACGNDRIDDYFRETVSQDVKRRYATCFVARDVETDQVAGFYTLSSSNVPLNEVPEKLAKKLPRYPTVPAVLIGWLGRHSDYAGIGLGGILLFHAIKIVASAPIGAHAIFAEAIDEKAVAFYEAFDFVPLVARPRTLFLPMTMALTILSDAQPQKRAGRRQGQ